MLENRAGLLQSAGIEDLFEFTPDIYLFVKDKQSRLCYCNSNMLQLFNVGKMSDIIGKNAYDFFPADVAISFLEDDQQVIEQGLSLINRLELNISEDGSICWFSTTKLPILDAQGQILGLKGISRQIQRADQALSPFAELVVVIEFIQQNFLNEINNEQLAALSHLSASQFQRRFKQAFHETPRQFILKLRIHKACRLLKQKKMNICEVSQACGFAEQNYFTRIFRQLKGMTPKAFRQKNS